MKKLLNSHVLFSFALAVVFLILIITDLDYNYQARMVPMIVAVPSFILAAAQFLIDVRATSQRNETVQAKIVTEKQVVLPSIAATDAPIKPPSAPAAVSESVLAVAATELANSPTVTRTATGKVIPNLEPNLIAAEAVKQERDSERSKIAAERRSEFIAIGWLLGLAALIALFGFYAGVPVFAFLLLKFHGRESWKFSVLYAVVLWGLMYLLFAVLMKSLLYPGMVFDRLGL